MLRSGWLATNLSAAQAAERDAADRRPLDAARVEQRQHLSGVVVEPERGIESQVAAALAAQRKRQHAERARESLDRRAQVFPPALNAGNQDEWRTVPDVDNHPITPSFERAGPALVIRSATKRPTT